MDVFLKYNKHESPPRLPQMYTPAALPSLPMQGCRPLFYTMGGIYPPQTSPAQAPLLRGADNGVISRACAVLGGCNGSPRTPPPRDGPGHSDAGLGADARVGSGSEQRYAATRSVTRGFGEASGFGLTHRHLPRR